MSEIKLIKAVFDEINPILDEILQQQTLVSLGHPLTDQKKLALSLVAEGKIVGGVTGTLNANEFHVNGLAIELDFRLSGYGKKLLSNIEKIAQEAGAGLVTLSTLSYQALDFYKKQGYEVFGQVDNVPFKGVTKYFLKKEFGEINE